MRLREGLSIVLLAAVAAACSGSTPAATDPGSGGNGGGGGGGGGEATPAVQPTPDGGGGGGGGGGATDNTARYEISGPVEASGELPFLAAFSRFPGDQAGMSLMFLREDGDETLTVYEFQGVVLVGFLSDEFGISTPTCQLENYESDASGASGSFDCAGAQVVTGEGDLLPDPARISGSFSARR